MQYRRSQLAGVELAEKLLAFTDFHSLGFPQREDTDRRRAITPALVAMTVTMSSGSPVASTSTAPQ
jgi:hypothetical protein